MKKTSCGVIGIGGIGGLHAEWLGATGSMQLGALCDVSPAMKEKAQEKFPGVPFYSDVALMLKERSIDFVIIASPHNLHAPLAIQCLEAGVNVMVEKPMATTYADCLKMIAAAEKAEKFLTVFHNRRFDPWFVKIQAAVAAGALGPLIELRTGWTNQPAWRGKSGWRQRRLDSGGLLFDWGAHLVDHLLHFEPSKIVSVSGFFYQAPEADATLNHDHGFVEIRFASGALGRMTLSALSRLGEPRYVLIGEKATLRDGWNWTGGQADLYATDKVDEKSGTLEYGGEGAAHTRYYENLAGHFQEGTPLAVTPQSAARVVQILELAFVSHSRGGVPLSLADL
jgi:predicted dehydrogenase